MDNTASPWCNAREESLSLPPSTKHLYSSCIPLPFYSSECFFFFLLFFFSSFLFPFFFICICICIRFAESAFDRLYSTPPHLAPQPSRLYHSQIHTTTTSAAIPEPVSYCHSAVLPVPVPVHVPLSLSASAARSTFIERSTRLLVQCTFSRPGILPPRLLVHFACESAWPHHRNRHTSAHVTKKKVNCWHFLEGKA